MSLSAVRDALDLGSPLGEEGPRVGRVAAMGLRGQTGCALTIEAAALRRLGLSFAGVDPFLNVKGRALIDGPSIGLAAALAMLSALTQRPLRQDLAVSGEISLHGELLPVGGLTQKKAAARLRGYKELLLPKGCGGREVFEAAVYAMALPKEKLLEAIASSHGAPCPQPAAMKG